MTIDVWGGFKLGCAGATDIYGVASVLSQVPTFVLGIEGRGGIEILGLGGMARPGVYCVLRVGRVGTTNF